jgi:hypothetical protein
VALGLQEIKMPLLRRPPSLHEKRVAEVRDATSKGGYGDRKAESDKLQSQLDEPDDPRIAARFNCQISSIDYEEPVCVNEWLLPEEN